MVAPATQSSQALAEAPAEAVVEARAESHAAFTYKADTDRAAVVAKIDAAILANDLDAARGAISSLGDQWQATARAKDATLATLKTVRDDLAFEMRKEANLPVGFPPVSPVGEIEIKQYPVYRLAKVEQNQGPQMGMFWQLFAHISKNDIPMTAPVEMEMQSTGEGESTGMSITGMAFLYESTEQGALGRDGNVEIVDAKPYLAVTMGMRGDMNNRDFKDARTQIEAWLVKNPQYVVTGEIRVLGYNSPSVPNSKKFYEVQIPVEVAVKEPRTK